MVFQNFIRDDIHDKKILAHILRRRVGIVFQTPQLLPTSIEKNIALPLYLVMEMPRKKRTRAIQDALKQVGLWSEVSERLKMPACELSGGQQARLCLSRALAMQPEVLLLDEPTATLDPHNTQCIEDLLQELKKTITIIAVSHNPKQVERLADHHYVMENGRIFYS